MTTLTEIAGWFDDGVNGAGLAQMSKAGSRPDYMLVVCDTFSHEDYPVYVTTEQFWEKHRHYNENMQRVIEVYDLHGSKVVQLGEGKSWHPPARSAANYLAQAQAVDEAAERLQSLSTTTLVGRAESDGEIFNPLDDFVKCIERFLETELDVTLNAGERATLVGYLTTGGPIGE